jgi:heme exporter protein CcmD
MDPSHITMPHWPFIAASYAVFALLIAADMLSITRAKRRVLRELRGRLVRAARREAP